MWLYDSKIFMAMSISERIPFYESLAVDDICSR